MQSRQHRQTRSQVRSLLSRLNNSGSDPGPRFEQCEPRQLLSSGFLFYDFDEIYPQVDEVLADLRAPEDARRFGAAVADLGDIDGDGVSDFIVGAPGLTGEEGFGQFHGKAFVFSGRSFEVLHTFTDGYAGFGSALAGVGDVNGDGVPDIAIGSPRRGGVELPGNERGHVYVHSGADGSLLYSLRGDAPGDRFGHELEPLFDFDGDGAMEFAIGAPGAGPNGEGQVFVISGDDGAVRDTVTGEAEGDLFGFAIGHDPLNGDFIVGAPGADVPAGIDAGRVYSHIGQFASVLWVADGEAAHSEFGYAVSNFVRASSLAHLVLVGAPGFDLGEFDVPTEVDRGRVYEFWSPFTAPGGPDLRETISGSSAGDRFGESIVRLGSSEALIGAPGAGLGGRVIVHDFNSGDTGAPHTTAEPGAGLGAAVAVLTGLEDAAFEDVLYRALGAPDARDDLGRPIGRVVIHSRFVDVAADIPVAVSPDGQYAVVLNSLLRTSGFSPSSLIIGPGFAGQFRNFIPADIDGMGRVLINDQLLIDGLFVPLSSLFTSIDGPDLGGAALVGVRLGENGQVLVRRGTGDDSTAWVIENGVLRHLWNGFLSDINASGAILGTRLTTDGGPNITTLRLADGTFMDIPGLFNAGAINDAGMVAGMDAQGRLAIWHEGQVVPLGQIPGWGSPLPTAINDAGEIVGTYFKAGGGVGIFYYSAETGLVDLADVAVAGAPDTNFGTVFEIEINQFSPIDDRSLTIVDLLDDGSIVGRGTNVGGFVLVPQSAGPFTSTATPIPATSSSGILVAGVNENGEPILFQQSDLPSGWTAIDVASFVAAPLTDSNVITFVDPKDNLTYIATATEDGLVLGQRGTDGVWTFRNLNDELSVPELIVTDIVHLQTIDNTFNIAGLSAAGELIMFFQTGASGAASFAWQFTNLYDNHLDPQEVERPRFVGAGEGKAGLIAYTTAWNALNFAGIDENGDVQVVWWSPDLPSGLWTATNLSDAAGTPRVAGGLSVYLTPWAGINLAAATHTGEVVVTWWVPDEEWTVNNLTEETGGPTLIASSLTAYTSPWGALNIVGVDESGDVQTYWWVPDGQDIWRVNNLTTEATGTILAFDPAAGLRGLAQPGNLNVFGTTEDDDVIRLTWTPDEGWLFENLSTAVVAA